MDFLVGVLGILCVFLLGWIVGWLIDTLAYVDIGWGRHPDAHNYRYVYVCMPLFGRWRYFGISFMDGKTIK